MTIIDASIIRFLALIRNSHDPGLVLRDSLMRAQLAAVVPCSVRPALRPSTRPLRPSTRSKKDRH